MGLVPSGNAPRYTAHRSSPEMLTRYKSRWESCAKCLETAVPKGVKLPMSASWLWKCRNRFASILLIHLGEFIDDLAVDKGHAFVAQRYIENSSSNFVVDVCHTSGAPDTTGSEWPARFCMVDFDQGNKAVVL